MMLSARMLNAVANVNDFDYVTVVQFTEGDAQRVYFQLVDTMKDRPDKGYQPSGRRFMPASGATLSVILENIDDAKKVSRAAVQAFPTSDPSIWYVQVLATDKVRGTVNLRLALTEGSVVTRGVLQNAVGVASQNGL